MSRLSSAPSEPGAIRRPVLSTIGWWLALVAPVVFFMQVLVGFADGGWDMGLVATAVAAALVLRVILPLGAFLITTTLATWNVTMFTAGDGWVPIFWAVLCVLGYLVGRADSGEQPLWIQFLLAGLLVVLLVLLLDLGLQEVILSAIWLPVFVIFPWLWGRYRYQHAQLTASGWQRARELELQQAAAAEQAKLRERTRIAEDMHDSLGHELSLIAVRAAALEVDATLAQRHRDAAGQLRGSAATATERLREIIGVLRADEETSSVTPADENVSSLVDRAISSGMDIALRTHGGDAELPPMADRAIYRVVQESLTNAAKHAIGQPVTVEITHETAYTAVTVSNRLSHSEETPSAGGGRGLVGLRERVRLAGGSLRYGAEGDRFAVAARVPHSPAESIAEEAQPSESARQMGAVQRRTRARLVVAIAAPAAILLLLAFIAGGLYWLAQYYSDLDPRVYQDITEGQTRAEIDSRLPMFEMLDAPAYLGRQGQLPGADCQYYRGPADPGELEDVYELCFDGDVLVAKEVITAEERYWDFENSYGR